VQEKDFDQNEQGISRRGFIKGAAITALAASAVGAGAAALQNQVASDAVLSAPLALPQTAVSPATVTDNPELLGELANALADNTRLQTQVSGLQQQLATLQQTNTSEKVTTESLTLQLDQTNEQLGIAAGLVALYERLDDIQLDELVEQGLTAVSSSITDLIDDLPGLEEGIQLGQVALNNFEGQLPLLQNGRYWLQEHVTQLSQRFTAVETILTETVERIGPLLTMIQEWFASVRKWLPFNIGEKAQAIMITITELITETPTTVTGMSINVAEPLDLLVSSDDQPHPAQLNLVNPIREKLIAKGDTAVAKARQVNDTFANTLNGSVLTAVEQQRIIKKQISAYRQQHNL
jgi:hypothetical protein